MTSASDISSQPGSIVQRDLGDLRALLRDDGPFFTALLPAPSHFADSAHRLDVEWRNVRRKLVGDERATRVEDGPPAEHAQWGESELAVIDDLLAGVPHDHGAAIAIVAAHGGGIHLEFIDEAVHAATVTAGPLPRLAPIIESRQRALPHLVIEIDRTGADIVAFDGGEAIDDESITGDPKHVHRGHPGGWSQRRYQQRAENAWERGAAEVAATVGSVAARTDPLLIAVTGDVRAVTAFGDALGEPWRGRVVELSAGDAEGVADEVVRRLSDLVANDIVRLADQLAEAIATDMGCTGTDTTLDALTAGRVSTLFVHDDRADGDTTDRTIAGYGPGVRVPDLAIALALRSGTDIVVVPRLALLDGPLGGTFRW